MHHDPVLLDLLEFLVPDVLHILNPLFVLLSENSEQEVLVLLQSFELLGVLVHLTSGSLNLVVQFLDLGFLFLPQGGGFLGLLHAILGGLVVVFDKLNEFDVVFLERSIRLL